VRGEPTNCEEPVASPNYALFEQAMTMRKQIVCMYGGYPRELCPIIPGHSLKRSPEAVGETVTKKPPAPMHKGRAKRPAARRAKKATRSHARQRKAG
jgi:hypothetical protein